MSVHELDAPGAKQPLHRVHLGLIDLAPEVGYGGAADCGGGDGTRIHRQIVAGSGAGGGRGPETVRFPCSERCAILGGLTGRTNEPSGSGGRSRALNRPLLATFRGLRQSAAAWIAAGS